MPHLTQLLSLLAEPLLVNGVALDDVVFEDLGGPLAELGATLRVYPVTHGENGVQVIELRLVGFPI